MMSKEEQLAAAMPFAERKYESAVRASVELDKDFLCPICLQKMGDAFLTRCGHNFCYLCITTHLDNRSNCPSCGQYLTIDLLMPNVLLTKLMKKAVVSKTVGNGSPAEHLRLALEQGMDLPVKEIDSLLLLLSEAKKELELETAESSMDILLEFLQRSQLRKQEELHEVQNDLHFLQDDIAAMKKRQHWLQVSKDKHYKTLLMGSAHFSLNNHPTCDNASIGGAESVWRVGQNGAYAPPEVEELYSAERPSMRHLPNDLVSKDKGKASGSGGNDRLLRSLGGFSSVRKGAKKRKVLAQFDELQEAYLSRRRQVAFKRQKQLQGPVNEKDACRDIDNYYDGLDDFQSMLTAYTRYSHLRVVAELHPADLFQSTSNLVSR